MVIIFFSHNQHKAREIEQILPQFQVRLYSDFIEPFSVVECGKSFAENAEIKLLALKNKLQNKAIENAILMAEDSGICVESLNDFPGIFSARFASLPALRYFDSTKFRNNITADSSDKDNILRLIKELKNRHLAESNAVFISCVACFVIKNGVFSNILTSHGFLNGKVIGKMRGKNGFGYDPIFVPCGFDKTLAEIPQNAKNALSHRKNALDLMGLLLR